MIQPATTARIFSNFVARLAIILIAAALPNILPAQRTSTHPNGSVLIQAVKRKSSGLEFNYSLPADGFVTLVIDDANGQRVRNLLGGAPRHVGTNADSWDGNDDLGQAVSSGDYRWRILFHQGIDADYIMSYGNPGTPPWATSDGTGGWGADHTKPQAAVTTPDGVILGWPTAEAGWFLIGVGFDSHKKWGMKNRYAFGDILINLATDGQYLYIASEQNAAPLMKYYKKLAHGVLYRYRISDRKLAKMGDADEVVITSQMDGNVRGVAVTGDTAYIALTKENKVVAVSLTGGRLDPDKDLSISSPNAIAVDKSGALIIASGQKLLRVDLKTKKITDFVASGLSEPVGLCSDPAGNIYVSDRGTAQQVKVFSPDGQVLRTIGKAGGRSPRGPHQPTGMYQPLGLTVDAQGLLWVMEEDDKPKRVSIWNAATGAFVREYIGPPHYGALEGSVSPFDKTMAFGEGVEYRLDWDKKIYSFAATPGRAVNDEDVFGRSAVRRVFQSNGRLLAASNSHVQVISELKNGTLRPLAAIGEIDELTRRVGMYTGALQRKIDQLKAAGSKVDAKGSPIPATAFIWTDQNGDGLAQDTEFTWKPNLHWGGYWGTGIGDDLTVYMQSAGKVYRLPVINWNAHGAPVYKFESSTILSYTGSAEHVTASPDNVLIVNAKPRLQGIDLRTGETRWSYPNPWEGVQGSHSADFPAPGRLIGPLSITGFAGMGPETGTLFAMNGNLGQQFLMTTDGLWVSALLRDWRLAKVEDMYTVPDEDFGGYFWRDQASGDVYLEAGKTEYRLYKVKGLETIQRGEGSFKLDQAGANTTSLPVQKLSGFNTPEVTIPSLSAPMKITGALGDAPRSMHFTEVAADANTKFRFALAHDQQNLYLVYDVTDETPFRNNGQDIRQMFATGDCVDLMLATDPKDDSRRKEGAAGDIRILFTVRDGKPVAVLYKQKDSVNTPPVAFMSPSRAVYFASVAELSSAQIAVSRSKTGYVLTASVPLANLGIKPPLASTLSGDVGVIFGSQSGNGARLRLYWSNKSTAITSDIPSEAALEPDHWGHFQFE